EQDGRHSPGVGAGLVPARGGLRGRIWIAGGRKGRPYTDFVTPSRTWHESSNKYGCVCPVWHLLTRKGGPMADITWQDSSAAILDVPSEAELPDPIEADEFDRTDRLYIVKEDDSLSSIARKFYGTASARRRIIDANRRLIRDPYLIQPGWRL